MKQAKTAATDGQTLAEQAEQANSAVFHRPDEANSYSRFTRDLQHWRGEQLRKYYADLENPQFRRKAADTKRRSSIDFYERLQGLLGKAKL